MSRTPTGRVAGAKPSLVDESKERDYLLVASLLVSGDLDDLRKLVRGFVLMVSGGCTPSRRAIDVSGRSSR